LRVAVEVAETMLQEVAVVLVDYDMEIYLYRQAYHIQLL
jgi:hypothetical protein